MSKRSMRTDDGTPLTIIQNELFEIQRQRRQIELQAPPGPPPDMEYYATVAPPQRQQQQPSVPQQNFNGVPREYDVPQNKPKPILKQQQDVSDKKNKKASTAPVPVDLQDPTDIKCDVPLVQERASSESVGRVKVGLVLTLLIFICLYAYPVITNAPSDQRASALTILSIAVGLGALGAAMWPMPEKGGGSSGSV